MTANDNTSPDRSPKAGRQRVCPICGKPRSKDYDPFCSKRCADIDLHRWLKGAYVIPSAESGAERDEPDEER
jgi:endogenous inhibitor of DNA gyrase (YacG/DUF329 family)